MSTDDGVVVLKGVRTLADTCDCADPWHEHPDGFVWDRANGASHFPQVGA